MDSARVRFYVRRQPDGRWSFGRKDQPFQVFATKAAAIAQARAFVAKLDFTELVVEQEAPPMRARRAFARAR